MVPNLLNCRRLCLPRWASRVVSLWRIWTTRRQNMRIFWCKCPTQSTSNSLYNTGFPWPASPCIDTVYGHAALTPCIDMRIDIAYWQAYWHSVLTCDADTVCWHSVITQGLRQRNNTGLSKGDMRHWQSYWQVVICVLTKFESKKVTNSVSMRSVLNEVTKAYWLTRFASKQSDNSVSIRSVLIKVTKAYWLTRFASKKWQTAYRWDLYWSKWQRHIGWQGLRQTKWQQRIDEICIDQSDKSVYCWQDVY